MDYAQFLCLNRRKGDDKPGSVLANSSFKDTNQEDLHPAEVPGQIASLSWLCR